MPAVPATVRFRTGRIVRRPLDLLPPVQTLPRREGHQLHPSDRDRRAHRTPALRARSPRERRSRVRHGRLRRRAPHLWHRGAQGREYPAEDAGGSRRPQAAVPLKRPRLPLADILVADFSRVLAGPLCTQLLADAGARVIKVEEPDRGDETRRWGPPFLRGVSAYFLAVNRNKESLAIDLKSRRGQAVAKKLIARADVVVDNFLPSQRTALGFDDLRRRNRRLIHCSISGFDGDSAEANTPGYDLLAQAESGLRAITGEPAGEPMKVGVALSDVLTAHHAVGAICAALYAREKTRRGARIEVSLFSASVASLVNVAQNALVTGKEPARWGNAHASIVPYQLFHGKDRPFAVGAGTDRHFASLCRVIDREDLLGDARFATNTARVG